MLDIMQTACLFKQKQIVAFNITLTESDQILYLIVASKYLG